MMYRRKKFTAPGWQIVRRFAEGGRFLDLYKHISRGDTRVLMLAVDTANEKFEVRLTITQAMELCRCMRSALKEEFEDAVGKEGGRNE